MRKILASAAFGVLLSLIGLPSQAQSYHFSSFATSGQSFQGSTLGLMTLTSENSTLVYTSDYGGGIYDGYGASNDITLNFSAGVSSVSIRAGDGGGDPDAFGMLVYAFGSNTLLGSFYTPVFDNGVNPTYYTLTVSGLGPIGKVVFDPCNSGICPGTAAGLGGVVVTDINYIASGTVAAVPEPATFALMIGGLGCVGWVARRRR